MKIPNKIKIGAYDVKIVFPYVFTERSDRYGYYSETSKKICITDKDSNGSELNRALIEQILLHEILHAVDDIYNGSNVDERDITNIAQGLYQALKDNDFLK